MTTKVRTAQEWTPERRAEMSRRILAWCDEVAEAIGARGVVIIGLFEERAGSGQGVDVHCIDAGKAPWSLLETYERMILAHKLTEAGLEGSVQ